MMGSGLADVIEIGCGADAELYELAALVAAPGAAPQGLHADTVWNEGGCLFTTFVALQPVSREMGPTRWIQRTHTLKAHAEFEQGKFDGGFVSANAEAAVCGCLDAGDASLYDSRIIHAGSANYCEDGGNDVLADENEHIRVLFYLTFRRATADAAVLANDEAHSILSKYRGRFTLAQLRLMGRKKLML